MFSGSSPRQIEGNALISVLAMLSSPIVIATRGIASRAPFRRRKPKLGAEPRNILPTSVPLPHVLPTDTPSSSNTPPLSSIEPPTHFKITLHRSAIGLPDRISRTLEALGIHRRMQTVYHRFSADIAGKILQVKELVEVQNVAASDVRTPEEARRERKAVRGYQVVSRARPSGLTSIRQVLHARRQISQLDITET